MIDRDRISRLLAERREGFSLPQAFYVDPAMHEADLKAVFETEWLFACNACEIRKPGDYLTLEIGDNPVVILRDRDGEVRAFHNSCRHRGSRICGKEKGRATRLVCPYHQWVYELDGSLLNARQMPADFDRSQLRAEARPCRGDLRHGLYLPGRDAAGSSTASAQAVTPYIAPHQPERTKVAFEMTLIEEANWKLVIENNRECYHCAGNHPELLVTLVEFALPDDPRGTGAVQGADGAQDREMGRARPAARTGRWRQRVPLHPPALP